MRHRYDDDISKTIVMQRWVLGGVLIDGGVGPDKQPAPSGGTHRSKRRRLWVNWALAVLTVLGAAVVMLLCSGP
jgi:hypothetical protein